MLIILIYKAEGRKMVKSAEWYTLLRARKSNVAKFGWLTTRLAHLRHTTVSFYLSRAFVFSELMARLNLSQWRRQKRRFLRGGVSFELTDVPLDPASNFHRQRQRLTVVMSASVSFTVIINQGDFQNRIPTKTRLKRSLPPQPMLNPTPNIPTWSQNPRIS